MSQFTVPVGQCVTISKFQNFLDGIKNNLGREYLTNAIEDVIAKGEKIRTIEIKRISTQVWNLVKICTIENEYDIKEGEIYIHSDFYHTKMLWRALPVRKVSSLLGVKNEYRIRKEYREIKEMEMMDNENQENEN